MHNELYYNTNQLKKALQSIFVELFLSAIKIFTNSITHDCAQHAHQLLLIQ